MKILIIEDEQALARFMAKGLQQAGHATEVASSGSSGMKLAASGEFDLILLDLMLPEMNGFDLLCNLRDFRIDTPVIIISALSQTDQVLRGFDLGAVDYIKKPFDWDELLARVRVAGKKARQGEELGLKVGELNIDTVGRKVFRSGEEIRLTAKEYLLLEYMARNANRIVSRNQIMEHVWELDFDTGSNLVEVLVYQLRKKIDREYEEKMLETIVGLGYVLKGEK